jgi:hypothetical protein
MSELEKIEQMLKDAKSGKTKLRVYELNALESYRDSLKTNKGGNL